MGNYVFPTLTGRGWDLVKSPSYNTKVQRATSGKEYRTAFMQYPLYEFTLTYDLLRDAATFQELQALMGFYNARQGSFDSFLFLDPSDSSIVAQRFATGDGATANFPLIRTYGNGTSSANELVQNPSANAVYANGVTMNYGAGAGNYQMSSNGTVLFGTAPANMAALTWTGYYYYRCRFAEDSISFRNFMSGLWDLKTIKFIGSPVNKV
jgi:uncharacterized protein (TIGR02217 family)